MRRNLLAKCFAIVWVIPAFCNPIRGREASFGLEYDIPVEEDDTFAEVEYIESTGSSYYQFAIDGLMSGNNQDVEIEWSMRLLKNYVYKTLLSLSPLTRNSSVMVNSIDGIVFVAGFNLSKYQTYPTTFSVYKVSRKSNVVEFSIDGEVVASSTGQYAIGASEINLFCRGDFASYAFAPAGYQFGYLRATFVNGELDIRAARIGSRGVLYDAITGEVYESMGETSAIPGPDIRIIEEL